MSASDDDLAMSESFAVSRVAMTLGIEREKLLNPLMQMKSLFETNRGLREAVRAKLSEGIPFTDKEALATLLKFVGGATGIVGIGQSAAIGAGIAAWLGLSAGAAMLISAEVFAILAVLIFVMGIAALQILLGVLDFLKQRSDVVTA